MKDARQIAYEILFKIQQENAYSNLALDSALEIAGLEARDSSLVSALVYGTLERLIVLDFNISQYMKRPVKNTKPEILTVLRLGAYQLLFMDKIPASAAVNESVKLIKKTKSSFASGLVNAVLHKIAKEGLKLPDNGDNKIEYLSVKYSVPEKLVSFWIKSYGLKDAIGIIETSLDKPKTFVRVNTQKTTQEELKILLEKNNVIVQQCDILNNVLILYQSGSIEKLQAFKDGLFHVQDLSSQLCCEALCAKPGDVIFDMCSAPGGKAFTLAQSIGEKGRVYAFDIYDSRLELIKSGAKRLNLSNIVISNHDAGIYDDNLGFADKVLCDVPCSGLGIIRRKPEIRYKELDDIDKLPHLQYFILCNASKYLKNGGFLAYSTCTLNPKENEEVCDLFLKNHPNFSAVYVLPNIINRYGTGSYLNLMPHINDTDGFFIALFLKTG